jgi:hypothetical protein
MRAKLAAMTVLCVGLAMGTAHAQECLHGTNETAAQALRRQEALTAARNINNIQANQPGARSNQYFRYEQLADSPFALAMRESTSGVVKRISLKPGTDILPGWQLTLDVTEKGYWFMIKDKADPCGFAYISNQEGVIFHGYSIGYDVQPIKR